MEKAQSYDALIIGAGMYGLYIAYKLSQKGQKVCILDLDKKEFQRASFVNQARVHNGYHYPRSIDTAESCKLYYKKFMEDFSFAINKDFQKIYAISKNFSLASSQAFERFCKILDIPAQKIDKNLFFKNPYEIEEAFLCEETSFDAHKISNFLKEKILENSKSCFIFENTIKEVEELRKGEYKVILEKGEIIQSSRIFNVSYAGLNFINKKFGFPSWPLKYELCEMVIGKVNKNLENIGITVMDGPFFSLMPFGLTGLHSLSSVAYTPHKTSQKDLPTFTCQKNKESFCFPTQLKNCSDCFFKPPSSEGTMVQLAKKYLKEDFSFQKEKNLFTIKTILITSELDDSRPTLIKEERPEFFSIFSGKINNIYDMDSIL